MPLRRQQVIRDYSSQAFWYLKVLREGTREILTVRLPTTPSPGSILRMMVILNIRELVGRGTVRDPGLSWSTLVYPGHCKPQMKHGEGKLCSKPLFTSVGRLRIQFLPTHDGAHL